MAIDTPSTDRGQSKTFRTHQVLGKGNVWGLENMANTDKLPASGFLIYNMVHKLEGGSGGPTRVIAVMGSRVTGAAVSVISSTSLLTVISIVFVLILY